MRFPGLKTLIGVILASAIPALAQNAAPEPPNAELSHFLLEVSGKKVGEATYQISPTGAGFRVKSNYSFNTNGTLVRCEREGELDAGYNIVKDWLVVNAARTDEDASIAVDPDRQHYSFKLKSSVQSIDQHNELHPGTVVLNNFDPSGMQVLVSMATSHPTADGTYWALLAQGKGVYMPVKLTTAEPADGKLNDKPLKLKHWLLQIQDTDTDLWADSENHLMAFVVPSQDTAYRRDGFERGQTAAESTPGANTVEERHVSFTSDGLKIPAILVIPKILHGPVPIVVMVAGSGPQDADETIGPNKPFRDIAYGLAAHGIGTLRYDKRTRIAPDTFKAHPDLDHEVLLDAVAAVEYAATIPEVNFQQVYVLGHSLGGTMAPDIVAHTPRIGSGSVKGLILLSAASVSIDQTIERQTAFQAKHHGATQAQLDQLQKQWQDVFVTIKDTNTPADKVAGIAPLQLPVGYWRSWLKEDPAVWLPRLHRPALNIRGTKDIQVSEQDFKKIQDQNYWPGSLGEEISGLNHLLMPVKGDSTGEEYMQPEHVSSDVIGAIASWIASL